MTSESLICLSQLGRTAGKSLTSLRVLRLEMNVEKDQGIGGDHFLKEEREGGKREGPQRKTGEHFCITQVQKNEAEHSFFLP